MNDSESSVDENIRIQVETENFETRKTSLGNASFFDQIFFCCRVRFTSGTQRTRSYYQSQMIREIRALNSVEIFRW